MFTKKYIENEEDLKKSMADNPEASIFEVLEKNKTIGGSGENMALRAKPDDKKIDGLFHGLAGVAAGLRNTARDQTSSGKHADALETMAKHGVVVDSMHHIHEGSTPDVRVRDTRSTRYGHRGSILNEAKKGHSRLEQTVKENHMDWQQKNPGMKQKSKNQKMAESMGRAAKNVVSGIKTPTSGSTH